MNGAWLDKFQGMIPRQAYTAQLCAGEENGLTITLDSDSFTVAINFGVVHAVQMLDEGVLLCGEDTDQLRILCAQDFPSSIYEIENGDFGRFVESQMGSDLYHALNCRQYIIVTLNYVICIVSSWEPEITATQK